TAGPGVLGVAASWIRHAGDARVPRTAAELLRCDTLAGSGLDQGWASQEDRALVFDDDVFVRHGRHVGATGGAGPEHGGQLRDSLGGHVGLVVEDAAEVVAVWEYLVLLEQHRPARVHEVDAGQVVRSEEQT